MTNKGNRLLAGVADIVLGILLAGISIYFYMNSSFEYSEVAKYIFFSIEMVILPSLGLFLIIIGIKNLVIKSKEELEE